MPKCRVVVALSYIGYSIENFRCGQSNMHLDSSQVKSAIIFVTIFLFSTCLLFGCTKSTESEVKNVVFVLVDTLAARHLGAYGATNSPSPNIDKLASGSVLFERAYSPAPWTKPAVASIFTGVMPSTHGVLSIDDILGSEEKTLAEYFKENNFSTAGFVTHTLISPELGYAQGFDSYETIPFKGNVHNVVSSEKVTNMAIQWMKNQNRDQKNPFLLFVHYFDPHNNYHQHPDFDRTSWYNGPLKSGMDIRELRNKIPEMTPDDIRFLKGLYDEEIGFTDRNIGRLLSTLDELEIADDTIVVLTADHGEEFLDHGAIGHSRTLYDELIHVPLIVKIPGQSKPQKIKEPVSTMDLLPTLLDLFSFKGDSKLQGVSLRAALTAGVGQGGRDIYSEVDFRSSAIKAYKIGLIQDNFKVVLDKTDSSLELFNLSSDPKEQKNLNTIETERLSNMSKLVREYQAKYQSDFEIPNGKKQIKTHTPEEVEQLKSLGYI